MLHLLFPGVMEETGAGRLVTPLLLPQVSFTSAALVLKSTQALLAQSLLSGRPAVAKGTMLELILLVSAIWEVSDQETPRNVGFLQEEGIKVISALLLVSQTSSSLVTAIPSRGCF